MPAGTKRTRVRKGTRTRKGMRARRAQIPPRGRPKACEPATSASAASSKLR